MVHIQKIIMKKEVDNEEHGNQQGQDQCGVEQSLKMERKMPYMCPQCRLRNQALSFNSTSIWWILKTRYWAGYGLPSIFFFNRKAWNARYHTFLSKQRISLASGGGGLVTKSCPTLATPWTVARQAPLSMRFSRQEYWSGLPFPSPVVILYHISKIIYKAKIIL